MDERFYVDLVERTLRLHGKPGHCWVIDEKDGKGDAQMDEDGDPIKLNIPLLNRQKGLFLRDQAPVSERDLPYDMD